MGTAHTSAKMKVGLQNVNAFLDPTFLQTGDPVQVKSYSKRQLIYNELL